VKTQEKNLGQRCGQRSGVTSIGARESLSKGLVFLKNRTGGGEGKCVPRHKRGRPGWKSQNGWLSSSTEWVEYRGVVEGHGKYGRGKHKRKTWLSG